jgi:putative ABC transport system ATP-binding protein
MLKDRFSSIECSAMNGANLRSKSISFVFQSFNLITVLSVYENIELPLMIRNDVTSTQRKEIVRETIQKVGLEKFAHFKPNKLSGGQRQRVAIARAIVTRPSIVLADEPTANLDSKTAQQIMDLLIEINEHYKTTFIFSTHDEKLINRVRRIIRIEDGTIV